MTQPSEPNEFNGLTRYDTYNIRPDLFQALKDGVKDYRAVVLGYVQQAREFLEQTEGFLVESRRLTADAKAALADSQKALVGSREALDGARASAAAAEETRKTVDGFVSSAQQAMRSAESSNQAAQKAASQASGFSSSASSALELSRQETSKAGEYSHQAFLHLQGATEQAVSAGKANTSAIDAMNKANAARDSAISANTSAIDALKKSQDIQADVSAKHQTVLEKHDAAIRAAQDSINANNKADSARDSAIEANRQAGLALANAQQVAQAQTDQLRKVQNTMQVTRTIAVMGDVVEMSKNGTGRMDVPGYGYLETNTGAFEATQLYFRKRGDWSGTVHFIVKFKGVATNDNVEIAGGRIEKWHPEDHGIGGKVGGVGYYTGFLMQIYPDPPGNVV